MIKLLCFLKHFWTEWVPVYDSKRDYHLNGRFCKHCLTWQIVLEDAHENDVDYYKELPEHYFL